MFDSKLLMSVCNHNLFPMIVYYADIVKNNNSCLSSQA